MRHDHDGEDAGLAGLPVGPERLLALVFEAIVRPTWYMVRRCRMAANSSGTSDVTRSKIRSFLRIFMGVRPLE